MPKEDGDKPKRKAAEKSEKKPRAAKKEGPKRALSAYMFFVQAERETVKEENPDAGFGELGKLLGARWKEMSDKDKKPYTELAEADKKRAAKDREDAGMEPKTKAKPKKAAKSKSVTPEEDQVDDDDD
ncbi:hypothetical protein EXIGLDRAFT_839152 [Exidia glandulosa HHB12029]|uniref:HMG box domain-containing protein n=1 Tax=Exidia glandulosa HHB12029 TaxID=1314781 RepID=A0A165F846_EXIGL|nr:hypothetical protein EXIGLDRAFT_839152 [Exidia glandulosa HHB12029]